MKEIQKGIMDFFTNEAMLKVARSIAVSLVIILLPLFYFGFIDTFSLKALITWNFGVIVIIITISIILATIETKSFAYDITLENDHELNDLEKSVEINSRKIKQQDKVGKKSVKWLTKYNKDQQKMYDELLTNDRLDKLENKALNLRIRGNQDKADKLDQEIKKLRKNGITDRNFIPYSIKKILNIESNGIRVNKKKGNNEINVNPKQINWVMTLINMLLRSSGVGLIGTIPFAINQSWQSVLLFYLGYVVVIIVTIFTQYLLTTYVTTHSYKKALREIINIQQQLLEHLGISKTLDLANSQLKDLDVEPIKESELDE